MLPTLYCLADSREHAEKIVTQLQAAGVPAEHLSALVASGEPQNRPAPIQGFDSADAQPATKVEKTAAGATAGTAAGVAAGAFTMSIVGLTPLLIIAPLVIGTGAAAGAAVGAAAGATGGSLADFGIPEEKQKSYQERLAAGSVLVAVRTEDEGELEKANAAMEQAGAKDIGLFRLTKRIR